jgi:hypothetical protein
MNFKQQVFQKHGNLRKLSSEVEKVLRDAVVGSVIISEFEKIGIKAKGTISSQEIKATRPQLKGPPSEALLGEMRQKRIAKTLSRH